MMSVDYGVGLGGLGLGGLGGLGNVGLGMGEVDSNYAVSC
jgi:hypothetical protein